MTHSTKQLEEKFNKAFQPIQQAELGSVKPRKFNRAAFIKAAQELQKVVAENDKHDASKA